MFNAFRKNGYFLFLVLLGCASSPEKDYEVKEQAFKDIPNTSASVVVPQSAYDALMPEIDSRLLPERFDVSSKNNPASSFFMGLVDGLGINMVIHPDVKQKITINLTNVTLEETLQAVRDSYGLQYIKTEYGYRILPNALQNKVFRLNYLNVSRQGTSGISVASGQIYSSESSDDSDSTSNRSTSTATKLDTQASTDFWRTLQQSVQVMVGNGGGRRVIVDAQAGLIVVRAFPDELYAVGEFLRRAELSLQKQVIIEAKILEVTLNDGFQAGIQWDSFGAGINATYASSSKEVAGSLSSENVTNPDNLAGIFSLNFNTTDFTGVIQLLQRQGEVQVLSSPRISTVNNQKAVIKVGTDEFFVTDVSTNTTTTTTSTNTSPEVSLTPFFSGIALDVTPQIGDNNQVILHVHPSVTEVVERNKVIEVGSNTFDLPMAFSSIRETDSIIKAQNGQVVVIGGLLQNKKSRTDARVPWLSRIPLIGALFQQTQQTQTKSELVILLQPKVIENDAWSNEVESIRRTFPSWQQQGASEE
ncbi:pilus (MSHA type) biogenesis protein MshL [Pseudomonas sp. HK3]|jgi:MSHA biogenesis protein MshL